MAYTVVPSVVDGDDLTDDFTLAVKAAIDELQVQVPLTSSTWTTPISSGITVGNGTTTATYMRVGSLVSAQFRFALGSSSAITGDVVLALPVTAAATNQVHARVGWAHNGTSFWPLFAIATATTSVSLRLFVTSGTYATEAALTSTIPFTWANGNIISIGLNYLAA